MDSLNSLIYINSKINSFQDLNEVCDENLPLLICMKNKKGEILNCNTQMVKTAGLTNLNDILGLTDYDLWSEKEAAPLRETDLKVIKTEKQQCVMESAHNQNNQFVTVTSIKSPLRMKSNKIIGIVGLSIIHCGTVLNKNENLNVVRYPNLSNRENECLDYFLKGFTAKETAIILQISSRTVEDYIVTLKKKLGCKNKREITKMFNGFRNLKP